MRVHTKIVIDIASGDVIEDESYEYDGPIIQCLGGGGEQTVETGPPAFVVPDIRRILRRNRRLSRRAEFFPGQTFAGFAPEQEQALNLQTQRALSGSPVTQAAQGNLASTLRGDFLAGGPGFDAAFQAASNRIIPQVSSAFGRAGRTGSGLARTAMTSALGDAFAGLFGQERGRQLQAASLAPTLASQDFLNINALADVGRQRQAMEQQSINEAMARHDFPFQQLMRETGLITSLIPGAGGVQRTPTTQNRAAGILGGALAGGALLGEGGALAPLFGVHPALGAIGGGLLGSGLLG